jgi:hypothetical protein
MPRLRNRSVVGVAALAITLAFSGCGATARSVAPAPAAVVLCAAQPNGAPCIKVLQYNHAVHDVIGYLSASHSPLAGRTWRLVLSRYGCDPGSGARPRCSAAATYPGPARHGRPPVQTSCRENGVTVTTPRGCHNTLAQEMGSFGDWAGFSLPKRFASRAWLCTAEQIRIGGSWREPDRALATTPVRACAEVSPA